MDSTINSLIFTALMTKTNLLFAIHIIQLEMLFSGLNYNFHHFLLKNFPMSNHSKLLKKIPGHI